MMLVPFAATSVAEAVRPKHDEMSYICQLVYFWAIPSRKLPAGVGEDLVAIYLTLYRYHLCTRRWSYGEADQPGKVRRDSCQLWKLHN